MIGCVNGNELYIGRGVDVEVAFGCPDTLPQEADYKYIGPANSKSFTMTPDTVDGTTDRTTGGVRANYVTYLTFELSIDGKVRTSDKADECNTALLKYFATEVAAARQPSLWVRATFKDVTIVAYCIISSYERSASDSDLVTYSASFSATESVIGIQITDTI